MRGDLEHSGGVGFGLEEGPIFHCEQRQGGKFGQVCRVCRVRGCVTSVDDKGFHK